MKQLKESLMSNEIVNKDIKESSRKIKSSKKVTEVVK